MKCVRSVSGLITVISLLLGVIWLCPATASAAPAFSSLGQMTADGLRVPGAMDLDGAGNLYVADARGGLVHKFSPYGILLQSFDLGGSGRGLAVTPDGKRLYVAQVGTVVVADAATGAELGALGPFVTAGEVDLDGAGNVFVADAGSMQVKAFDAAGSLRATFGGVGTGAGQFQQIGGMAVNPAGQLVVADSSATNAKVHVFTLSSGLGVVGTVTYSNASAANFGSPAMFAPRGFAFDANGRGFFLESISSQLRVTSASFASLGAYTAAGNGAGQLADVTDAIFDNVNKRLFVGCGNRIEILGVDGGANPVRVNRAPSAPVAQSPVGGSEVASANPVLTFANATDADGDALTYNVSVQQGGAVVYTASIPAAAGATTSATVSVALAENQAYSWTVQAFDGEALSAVSAAAGFVVNAREEAPAAPALSAPVAGESIDGKDALSWSVAADPDPNDKVSYLVEVALDDTFAQVVAAEELSDTSLALGAFAAYGDLADGAAYAWRVSAKDDSGLVSAPSAAGRFVYDTTLLTVTANMPGASVSFNGNLGYAGRFAGTAPFELRDVTPGSFSVVVERSGFEPFVAQVTLGEGDNVDLYAALAPAIAVKNLSVSRNGINGRSGLAVNGAAVPFLVDFDGDGDLDMLVGDGAGQLTLFANLREAGSNRLYFDRGASLGLPVLPGAVPFVADWNNDGRKDLLIGLADGSVKLFVNNGLDTAPAFAAAADLQTVNGALYAGSNAAPAVADVDGDGAKDLLVGNGAGQLLVFINRGSDAAPLLAAPTVALQLSGAVVPFPVDWDADGGRELLITSGGSVTVYTLVDGIYKAGSSFGDRRSAYAGAFPIALGGSGKQLLAGQVNGELAYLSGNGSEPVASFGAALLDKVDELAGLVADANPLLLDRVSAIGALISAGDYDNAGLEAKSLASALDAGAARTSALELAELL